MVLGIPRVPELKKPRWAGLWERVWFTFLKRPVSNAPIHCLSGHLLTLLSPTVPPNFALWN